MDSAHLFLLHAEMWISKALSHCLVSLTNVKLTTLSFFLFLPQASKSTTRAVPPLFTENASKQSLLFYCSSSVVSCREAVKQNYPLPLPPLFFGIRSIFFTKFSLCVSFLFCKVEPPCLLFIYLSPSASYVLKYRNFAVIACSLARLLFESLKLRIDLSQRVSRGSCRSCRYLGATNSRVVRLLRRAVSSFFVSRPQEGFDRARSSEWSPRDSQRERRSQTKSCRGAVRMACCLTRKAPLNLYLRRQGSHSSTRSRCRALGSERATFRRPWA